MLAQVRCSASRLHCQRLRFIRSARVRDRATDLLVLHGAEKTALLKDLETSRIKTGTPESIRDARRQGLEDMFWALLTSKEFLFNH